MTTPLPRVPRAITSALGLFLFATVAVSATATGAAGSHMVALAADEKRAFSANVFAGWMTSLDLQQKKRDLADAILNENRNVIGTLTKDDLEFLLS